jgi:hypothetical protein
VFQFSSRLDSRNHPRCVTLVAKKDSPEVGELTLFGTRATTEISRIAVGAWFSVSDVQTPHDLSYKSLSSISDRFVFTSSGSVRALANLCCNSTACICSRPSLISLRKTLNSISTLPADEQILVIGILISSSSQSRLSSIAIVVFVL